MSWGSESVPMNGLERCGESADDLPPQAASVWVLRDKYLQPSETGLADLHRRVARAVAVVEPQRERGIWEARFLQALNAGFLPSGRILATVGTAQPGTLMSCFVQPMVEPLEQCLRDTAKTLQWGGGVGSDLSSLPSGSASGGKPDHRPVETLQRMEAQCTALESLGSRRGAQMAVLHVDHPDLMDFIHAKDHGGLAHFNLAVGLTDEFMRSGSRESAQEPVRQKIWHALTESAWARGEPGVLFLDTIRRENWLTDIEDIRATNPCGEQPLPDYGSCCLGAIDLTRFVRHPFDVDASWDQEGFERCVRVAVRMLDRVIDLTAWPLPAQRQEALLKRRMGLGWTGLADALLMLNLSYDTPQARAMAARMARVLRDTAIMASIDLALELGPFPAFRPHRLDPGVLSPASFMGRLPEPLRERARLLGLRNSHLLALAPTGSISIACADNVSPGIEPVWAWATARQIRDRNARLHTLHLEDHAWRLYRHRFGPDARRPQHFKVAHQVSPQDHLAMMAEVAPFIDGGISKTVNVPETTSRKAVSDLLVQAWRCGLKGLTVFRSTASRQAGAACATQV